MVGEGDLKPKLDIAADLQSTPLSVREPHHGNKLSACSLFEVGIMVK